MPSAYFLEVAGAKGRANGGVRVATITPISSTTTGRTALEVRELIGELNAACAISLGLSSKKKCSTSKSQPTAKCLALLGNL